MISQIPITIFLIPYLLFVGLTLALLFFNIHHLRRFGIKGVRAQLLALCFSVGTVILLGASGIYLSRFDWSQTIDMNSIVQSLTNTKLTPSL